MKTSGWGVFRSVAIWLLVSLPIFLMLGCGPSEPASSQDVPARGEATSVKEPTVPDAAEPPPTEVREETREHAKATGRANKPASGEALKITFLDVGQGSSALIQLPNSANVLIDGGPREGGPQRVADLQRLGGTQLDAVVISHADEDHAGGLIDVLRSVPVSAVYDSGYPHTTETYADLLDAIESSEARYVETRTGQSVDLSPEVSMEFLYPDDLGAGTNESSLALYLEYGEFSAQFTGDLGFAEEQELLASGRLSPVTLLEVGHHGSAGSSSSEFLSALSSEIGVVQVGEDNSYGHPTEEALTRLAAAGAGA
jgi:competence protein ComEC